MLSHMLRDLLSVCFIGLVVASLWLLAVARDNSGPPPAIPADPSAMRRAFEAAGQVSFQTFASPMTHSRPAARST